MSAISSPNGTPLGVIYRVTQNNTMTDVLSVMLGSAPRDLTGWTIYLTVKKFPGDSSADALFLGNYVVNPGEGIAGQIVMNRLIAKIPITMPVGSWSFDIVGVDTSGAIETIMSSQQGGGWQVDGMVSSLEN